MQTVLPQGSPLPPALFLMGPTASGKTDLALSLVRRLPCDVISVDSTMVYRGMDIGSAKPSQVIQQETPHRLIDIRDPAEGYSAAQFRVDALAAMADITKAGRIPLLVGGTSLYFRALERGLTELPPADPRVRATIEAQARSQGWEALHQQLAVADPITAARIHPHDPQRIQRALEILALTGQPPSVLYATRETPKLPYQLTKLVLAPADRGLLHQRIAERFKQMLIEGLVPEVENLYNRADLGLDKPALRAVGYRQVWEYLDGITNYEAMMERAIAATRQLARRQLTWLRAETDVCWMESTDPKLLTEVLHVLEERKLLTN